LGASQRPRRGSSGYAGRWNCNGAYKHYSEWRTPRETTYKLYDEKGLLLSIEPSGVKLWRFKYRYAGKEKKLALGRYPETSLPDARNKRDEARKQLEANVDPASKRRAERLGLNDRAKNTFEAVANEYIEKKEREGLAEITIGKARWLLKLLESGLRGRPIVEITAQELLGAIRKIEKKGNLETARRMRSLAGRVFRYGIATGRAERDLSVDIRDALTTPTVTHRAAILDPPGVGALLRAIDGYSGQPSALYALQRRLTKVGWNILKLVVYSPLAQRLDQGT